MNNNNDTSEFDSCHRRCRLGRLRARQSPERRRQAQQVLLLEAGPKDTNIWIHVPLGYGKLFKEKSVNWMYQTEPEPGLNGRQVFQPRGKVLGGSSSINGLLYVRGQHEDYDRWRQRGNAGWGFDDVLPYFKRAENQQRGPDKYHGVGGPLAGVRLAPCRSAVGGLCQGGGGSRHPHQSGFQRRRPGRRRLLPDHDAARPPRLERVLLSASRAEARQSACRDSGAGAAHPVRGPPRQGGRIQAGRPPAHGSARKEILVSSGAYNSPQLLQLSGVGPADLLKQHGIEIVLDAPWRRQ